MRIALVSDIHGNLPALEAVAADIRRRGVDLVVNLGDSLSGPLLPLETAQYLMAQGWLCLAGNHERQMLSTDPAVCSPVDAYAHAQLTRAELDWIATLPATARPTPEIFLCHGTPTCDTAYFLQTVAGGGVRAAHAHEVQARLGAEAAPLLACGHTHLARHVRSHRGQVIINPGSVGLPAYDEDHPQFHVVEAGSPDAHYAIAEQHRGQWQVALLAVPYDFAPIAQLAQQRGYPDWAHALRTGYMATTVMDKAVKATS